MNLIKHGLNHLSKMELNYMELGIPQKVQDIWSPDILHY